VVLAMLGPAAAHAQATVPADANADETQAPLRLKASAMLAEKVPDSVRPTLPSFFFGDRFSGRSDLDVVVEGNAELRRGGTTIKADRIDYYQPDDQMQARGNVLVNRNGNSYTGPELDLKVDAFEGFFTQPTFHLLKNDGYGTGDRVDFVDEKHAIIRNASYTTCQRRPGPSWMPDWIINATSIRLDDDTNVGTAEGAVLRFKDTPIMALPSLSFPLSDERKSGWLPPTFNVDSTSGLGIVAPYYWNIAPNRDATLYTSAMSKRGFDFGGEFRYLEPSYKGLVNYDLMPSDSLRNGETRWGLTANQSGSIPTGIQAVGNIGLNLNVSRVSDNNYWSDFPRSSSSLTQRLLAGDASVSWTRGPFSLSLRTLQWQVLQDPAAPIVPPYNRLPELTARYSRTNVYGFDGSIEADYTRFMADPNLTLQPNGQRSYVQAQISRPWISPGWYVTPKLMVNATRYDLDAPLNVGGPTTIGRVVPTFSVDSGLTFERTASYFGRSFTQTLEPRAFYVYTPFRNQDNIPIYDTGATDFNFATIFSESPFSGYDRIADNNLLTLGVTSRLLDPATGAEAARFALAQRLRFKDQLVTLPGTLPDNARVSDLLLGASVNWTPKWSTDSTIQYNQSLGYSERATIGGRYSPTNYRVLSATYSYQRGISNQLDLGWQWPINDLWGDRGEDKGPGRGLGVGESGGRWYSVGRLNYSYSDHGIVDMVLGIEYDAGCWLARIVLDKTTTSSSTALSAASSRILMQLEFVGFSRIGTNPLQTLRQNIPRYQYLRENITNPSRFGNYD